MRSTNRLIDQSVAESSRTCINSFAFFLLSLLKRRRRRRKGPRKRHTQVMRQNWPAHGSFLVSYLAIFLLAGQDGGGAMPLLWASPARLYSSALFVHEQKSICASIHPSIQQELELFLSPCFRLKWTTLVAYKCAGWGESVFSQSAPR